MKKKTLVTIKKSKAGIHSGVTNGLGLNFENSVKVNFFSLYFDQKNRN